MRSDEEEATRSLLSALAWHPVDADMAEDAGALGRRWLPSHHTIDGAVSRSLPPPSAPGLGCSPATSDTFRCSPIYTRRTDSTTTPARDLQSYNGPRSVEDRRVGRWLSFGRRLADDRCRVRRWRARTPQCGSGPGTRPFGRATGPQMAGAAARQHDAGSRRVHRRGTRCRPLLRLREGALRAVVRRSGSQRPENSLSCLRFQQQRANRTLVQYVSIFDVLLGAADSCHGRMVAEQLKGCFDRFEIFGGEQDDVCAAVSGDLNSLMGRCDLFGNLRKSSFDLRQRQRRHRPKS